MATLPFEIADKVESLIRQGDALKQNLQYRNALKPYIDAFALLPDPTEDWVVSVPLFTSLGY
jgi:hypothetical protein